MSTDTEQELLVLYKRAQKVKEQFSDLGPNAFATLMKFILIATAIDGFEKKENTTFKILDLRQRATVVKITLEILLPVNDTETEAIATAYAICSLLAEKSNELH